MPSWWTEIARACGNDALGLLLLAALVGLISLGWWRERHHEAEKARLYADYHAALQGHAAALVALTRDTEQQHGVRQRMVEVVHQVVEEIHDLRQQVLDLDRRVSTSIAARWQPGQDD